MDIQAIDINKLKKAKYNPRKDLQPSDIEYQKIKKSIQEFGYVEPIIINKDCTIIGGHQRLKVLKDLGYEEVQVVILDVDKTKEKALNIALNKISGEWDLPLLKDLLQDIDTGEIDIELTGFDNEEIEQLLTQINVDIDGKAIEDDFDVEQELENIEEQQETRVKRGEVWQLGRHRLMCGDSTNENDVKKLMDGKKAVLAHNDPPYGMKKEKQGVINDNLNYDDLLIFNKKWIELQFKYLEDNGSWYSWGIDEPLMDIYSNILKPMIKNQKATFRNLITWNKSFLKNGNTFNPFGASGSNLMRSYPKADEKCLFVMFGVQGFNNNADNYFEGWETIRDYLLKSRLEMGWDVPTMKKIVGHSDLSRDHWTSKSQFNFPTKEVYNKMKAEADRLRNQTQNEAFKKEYEELKKEYEELKKEYYDTRAYFKNVDECNNVWNIEITKGSEKDEAMGHATPKPLELCARVIKTSSKENDLVIDMFGGSGSTLIACEQLKRQCNMMEFETKWCDVIIARWEKLTGKQAIKIEGGEESGEAFIK